MWEGRGEALFNYFFKVNEKREAFCKNEFCLQFFTLDSGAPSSTRFRVTEASQDGVGKL